MLGGRISRRNFVPRDGTRSFGARGVPTWPPRSFPDLSFFPFPSLSLRRRTPGPVAVPVGAAIVVDEGAVGVALGADGGPAARPALRRRRGFVDPLQAPLLARERHQRSGVGARRGEAQQSIGAPRCRSLRPGAAPGGRGHGRRRAPTAGAAPGGGRPSRRAPQQPAGRPGAPHAGRGGGSNRCREVGRRNGGGSGALSTHTDTARLGSARLPSCRATRRGMLWAWQGTARCGAGAATALLPLPVPVAVPAQPGPAAAPRCHLPAAPPPPPGVRGGFLFALFWIGPRQYLYLAPGPGRAARPALISRGGPAAVTRPPPG